MTEHKTSFLDNKGIAPSGSERPKRRNASQWQEEVEDMDSTTFDTVARNLSTTVNRRSALHGLVAGALAVTVGGSALETSAKRRRKSRKHRTFRPGDFCRTDKQCQQFNGDSICGRTGPFTDERVCCGGIDALCDETGASGQSCCYGYLCASGRCIVV
jgi:hypothetical protein